jgi:hypothetical protein
VPRKEDPGGVAGVFRKIWKINLGIDGLVAEKLLAGHEEELAARPPLVAWAPPACLGFERGPNPVYARDENNFGR